LSLPQPSQTIATSRTVITQANERNIFTNNNESSHSSNPKPQTETNAIAVFDNQTVKYVKTNGKDETKLSLNEKDKKESEKSNGGEMETDEESENDFPILTGNITEEEESEISDTEISDVFDAIM
jgi:hypothetical protein